MKHSNRKRSVTDREKVINSMISATRKNIIATELEAEFLEISLEKIPEPQTEEDIKGVEMMANQVQVLKHTINISIDKLNFLKQKRTDFHIKREIKNYKRYPKTIQEADLIEVPQQDTED